MVITPPVLLSDSSGDVEAKASSPCASSWFMFGLCALRVAAVVA